MKYVNAKWFSQNSCNNLLLHWKKGILLIRTLKIEGDSIDQIFCMPDFGQEA